MQNYEYSSLFWDSSVDKQLVMKYDNARIDNLQKACAQKKVLHSGAVKHL